MQYTSVCATNTMVYYTRMQCSVSHSITIVTPTRIYQTNYHMVLQYQNAALSCAKTPHL